MVLHKSAENAGRKRIAEQQKLFKELFDGFRSLVHEIRDERTWVAFELSRRCAYWTWQSVQKWLASEKLVKHHFDGCAIGLVGESGQPMLKGWTVASDMSELDCLDAYRCDGTHEHEQSRGIHLRMRRIALLYSPILCISLLPAELWTKITRRPAQLA